MHSRNNKNHKKQLKSSEVMAETHENGTGISTFKRTCQGVLETAEIIRNSGPYCIQKKSYISR